MIKLLAAVVRRENISHGELVKVWEEVHAPHVVKIIKPERYRITFFDEQATPDDPGYDGMAELWFRDKDHFNNGIGRNAPAEVMDDHFSDYADLTKGIWLPVVEHINVDGPITRDTTKLVYFVKRRPSTERSHLDVYWINTHVPNVVSAFGRSPQAKRYTVDLVDLSNSTKTQPYDGIAQICMEGDNPRFADMNDYEPDGFADLVEPMLIARGHEVCIIS